MRYFMGLVLALALGVMGCSETSGTGGTAGDGGAGGVGGDGGMGGSAGTGGTGGVVRDCTGVGNLIGCTSGDVEGFCAAGECAVFDYDCSAVADETFCLTGEKCCALGRCSGGDCLPACSVLEEGAPCNVFSSWEIGECSNGSCIPFCENDEDCIDFNNCTTDTCSETGLCAFVPLQDGTPCPGGRCKSGVCSYGIP